MTETGISISGHGNEVDTKAEFDRRATKAIKEGWLTPKEVARICARADAGWRRRILELRAEVILQRATVGAFLCDTWIPVSD